MSTPNGIAVASALLACPALGAQQAPPTAGAEESKLELGPLSGSLAVKDIAALRAFCEKLGFAVVLRERERNWLIPRNGATTLELFQGMFERNEPTFNPGGSADAKPLEKSEDVRAIQRRRKAAGLTPATGADARKP